MRVRDELSARRLVTDGALLSALVGAIIVGSLRWDAEMWLQDYPPDVKAAFGPMSEASKRRQRIIVIPFFIAFFGILIRSTRRLRAERGGKLSFAAAFLHAFLLYQIFVAFDTFVIDGLFLGLIRPDWVILPGTEGMAGYSDYGYTLRITYGEPRPWIGAIVISLIVAAIARK
jgi:hypothetical protein